MSSFGKFPQTVGMDVVGYLSYFVLFHFTSIKETSGRVKHYMKKATKYTCRPVREYH